MQKTLLRLAALIVLPLMLASITQANKPQAPAFCCGMPTPMPTPIPGAH